MSDTDAEIGDCYGFIRIASGRVLIHGLGLGVVLSGVLAKKSVTSVDVVEIDKDVIELVGKHFTDPRLTIHNEDCLQKVWKRGTHWEAAFHDIFDNICADNLPIMNQLEKKFKNKCDWQACWAKEWIR